MHLHMTKGWSWDLLRAIKLFELLLKLEFLSVVIEKVTDLDHAQCKLIEEYSVHVLLGELAIYLALPAWGLDVGGERKKTLETV